MPTPPHHLHRTFALRVRAADAGPDTDDDAYDVSLSSDEPVDRWFGLEILDHSADAIDLSRAEDGLPLLANHDSWDSLPIGRIRDLKTDGGKLRGKMSFAPTSAGRDAKALVDFGHREMSIGYSVEEYEVTNGEGDAPSTYRATRWTPMEGSLVAVPADFSIGVGRSADRPSHRRVAIMSNDDLSRSQRRAARSSADVEAEREREYADRAEEIRARAHRHGIPQSRAEEWIRAGTPLNVIDAEILEARASRPTRMPAAEQLEEASRERFSRNTGDLFPAEELRKYSLCRALLASLPDADRRARQEGGFELECSRALSDYTGREARGIMVPDEIFYPRSMVGRQVRTLLAGTSTAGAELVATQLLADEYITALRNEPQVVALGARTLTGLVGNVAVPRESAGLTPTWAGEDTDAGTSEPTFDQPQMTPHDLSVHVEISRRLLQQSTPAVDSLVRSDIGSYLNIGVDQAAVNGSGSAHQPLGILGTSGVGIPSLGAAGGAPTWDAITHMIQDVASANALRGSLGFLTNGALMGTLMRTLKSSSSTVPIFIWEQGLTPGEGAVAGYRARVSNSVPSNLTKTSGSNLSAIIFGNFDDVLIGVWGGVELLVDPYSLSKKGGLSITGFRTVDILIRHGESFAALVDAVTT